MNERLLEWIMKFRIELIPDSTVYTISDWCHATFREFSFEYAKWYDVYRISPFLCKEDANPMLSEDGIV